MVIVTSYLSDTETMNFQAGSTDFGTGSGRVTISDQVSAPDSSGSKICPLFGAGSIPVQFRMDFSV